MLEDIPVGVYDSFRLRAVSRRKHRTFFDESYLARRLRPARYCCAPTSFSDPTLPGNLGTLAAGLGAQQAKELTPDGIFIDAVAELAYLGWIRTKAGRELDEALRHANHDRGESDLVSPCG